MINLVQRRSRAVLPCVLAVVSMLNAGCFRQYARPQFDPENAQFKGVASQLLQSDHVDVLLVHGMCTHTAEEWIDRKWDPQIRATLNATRLADDDKNRPSSDAQAKSQIISRVYRVGPKTLTAKFLLWSPLTTQIKQDAVAYDNPAASPGGQFTWRRAWLNGKLKTDLVNDCLTDPMIYSGTRGTEIKEDMKQRICEAFMLKFDQANQTCIATDDTAAKIPPMIIVAESLGSKMVFDAVTTLVKNASPQSDLIDSVASIPQVFMLANQLPLLELMDEARLPGTSAITDPTTQGSTLNDFARALRASRATRSAKAAILPEPTDKVSIVAFTDPNDLLSYRLMPDRLSDIDLINVIGNNAPVLFGFVAEMPTTAHTGYANNDRFMRLVMCGHQMLDDCKALRERFPPGKGK